MLHHDKHTLEFLAGKHQSLLEAYKALQERMEEFSPILGTLRNENTTLHELLQEAVNQLDEKSQDNANLVTHIQRIEDTMWRMAEAEPAQRAPQAEKVPVVTFKLPTDPFESESDESNSETETETTSESDTTTTSDPETSSGKGDLPADLRAMLGRIEEIRSRLRVAEEVRAERDFWQTAAAEEERHFFLGVRDDSHSDSDYSYDLNESDLADLVVNGKAIDGGRRIDDGAGVYPLPSSSFGPPASSFGGPTGNPHGPESTLGFKSFADRDIYSQEIVDAMLDEDERWEAWEDEIRSFSSQREASAAGIMEAEADLDAALDDVMAWRANIRRTASLSESCGDRRECLTPPPGLAPAEQALPPMAGVSPAVTLDEGLHHAQNSIECCLPGLGSLQHWWEWWDQPLFDETQCDFYPEEAAVAVEQGTPAQGGLREAARVYS